MQVAASFDSQPCDLLIALHAGRSADSITKFREHYPDLPIVLVLTGTDLYRDIHTSSTAKASLEIADRLVVLQEHGILSLPEEFKEKTRVIFQSVLTPGEIEPPLDTVFEVCVVGHLREVKDPLRTAIASRDLPKDSRIQIIQIGASLDETIKQQAIHEAETNSRYQWLGEIPHDDVMRRLGRARLLSLTSEMEGGANVISEAIVSGTPVISSHISGSIGLLGQDYPGFFEPGNTAQLTDLLLRTEMDEDFYRLLVDHCRKRKPLFDPANEIAGLQALLAELG